MKLKTNKKIFILAIFLLFFVMLMNLNTANAAETENIYVTSLGTPKFEYTGKAVKPTPNVNYSLTYVNSTTNEYATLEAGKDYTPVYDSNITSIGKKNIKFKMLGKYTKLKVNNYTYYITPKKIKNIKLDEVTSTSAKVSWERQANDKGEFYFIYLDEGDKGGNTSYSNSISLSSYKAEKLKPGTKYAIGVAVACGGIGERTISDYTKQVFVTIPNRTSNFKVTDINETKSKISWSGDSNSTFDVYLSTTGQDTDYELISTTKNKYIEIDKSKLENEYKIKVIAYVLDGEKRVEAKEGIYTKNITPNTIPSGLKISLEKTGLKTSWNKIEGVTGYKIYRSTSKNSGYTLIKTTSENSYVDTKVSNGKTYYYKVLAYNRLTGSDYCTGFSNIVSRLNVKCPNLYITSKDTSANFSWTKMSGVTGYRIYRATSINGTYKQVKVIKGANNLKYTNSGLKKYRKYYYKIRAYYTYKGKNYYSTYSSIVTREALQKVSISGVSYNTKGYNTVKWKKVKNAKGYYIYRALSKNGKYSKIKTITSNKKLSYNDKKVSVGTRYYYKVMAYKGSLKGQFSNVSSKVAGTRIQQLNKLKLKTKSTGDATLDKYLSNMIQKANKAAFGTTSASGKSNYNRIKAIYTYVEKNLRHYKGYNCKDFSGTYCALLNYIGINTYCVEGKTKSGSGWTAHTWVILELNGTKYVFDPSIDRWSAGDKTSKLSYKKFFKTESEVKKSYKKDGKTFAFIDDIVSGKMIGVIEF